MLQRVFRLRRRRGHHPARDVRRDVEWVRRDEAHSGDALRPYLEPARVVVDVGPGIRPQTILSPEIHVCVEPYRPYVAKLREITGDDPHFVFLTATWDRVLPLMPDDSVDSVVALDVIEHLERRQGKKLLAEARRIARQQVIIFTPLGFYDQSYSEDRATDAWGMEGVYWQTHRSGWTPDDFSEDWHIVACSDFHTVNEDQVPLDEPFGAFWAIYGDKRSRDKTTRAVEAERIG
jgi:Methyltransferase domain